MFIELLDQVMTIIEDHGLPLVALVVIVIWLVPKLDELWRRAFPKNLAVKVERLFKTDLEVNKVLTEVINKLNAGWATVWQFHNGSITMMGVPFLKVSATHTEVARGCSRHAELFQGMSTSLLGDLSPLLVKETIRLMSDATTPYAAITTSMKAMGIKTLYAKPLFSVAGDLVGALTVSFREDIVLREEQLICLEECKEKVVILLDRAAREKRKKEEST